jgi:hypothetical protein
MLPEVPVLAMDAPKQVNIGSSVQASRAFFVFGPLRQKKKVQEENLHFLSYTGILEDCCNSL